MFNMRIDIIRKELERRYQDLANAQGKTREEVWNIANTFLHFLLTEPMIKLFLLELSRYKDDFYQSKEFNNICDVILASIKKIIIEIDKSDFVDDDFKERLHSEYPGLDNPFNIPNPAVQGRFLSIDQFLEGLRNFNNFPDNDIDSTLNEIIRTLRVIFKFVNDLNKDYNHKIIKSNLNQIIYCHESLKAFLNEKPSYEGAVPFLNLLINYMYSPYWRFSGLSVRDFTHGSLDEAAVEHIFPDHFDSNSIIEDCKILYYAVDKYLMTGKSKNALIERLKTYCMWIKQKEFPKSKAKAKYKNEKKISDILEEFIFNHGYFPIVNFKTGKSIPDILAMPSSDIRWDNSALIELKQYIGKSYSDTQFRADVGQASDYLSIVKGVKPDVADVVYLLVFYAGNKRYVLDKSFSSDNIQVEFIYVGKKTPSKLKDEKIFGSK